MYVQRLLEEDAEVRDRFVAHVLGGDGAVVVAGGAAMAREVRAAALRLLARGLREAGVPGDGEEAAAKILRGMTKRGTWAVEAW
eukprot:CAMPEP_0194334914 /NCGR_PEP_ID=MMETSP0171-20130528/67725_1 /TAXON_ID=218684 /ORGANISM="Corethron pennatum, Strain L29A3" /LENGTH=83 /DNA_ID=CAMNT_0039097767 /DNA_START=1 /DNA_END=252 /DNA_ORIENTATION=-